MPADECGHCKKSSRQRSDEGKLIHRDEECKLDPESCGEPLENFQQGQVGDYLVGEIL